MSALSAMSGAKFRRRTPAGGAPRRARRAGEALGTKSEVHLFWFSVSGADESAAPGSALGFVKWVAGEVS